MRSSRGGWGVAPQLAWAGVEFDPFYQYPQPYYFSSTNARAYHHASVTPPSLGIARTELYVGGKLVAEEDYPVIGPLYMYEAEHSVMFDSSVFNDGDEVEVELKVWTNDGGPYESEWSSTVNNKASAYGRFDLDVFPLNYNNGQYWVGDSSWFGLHAAKDGIEAMNYNLHRLHYLQYWDRNDVFPGAQDSNVFYVHTHGNHFEGQPFFWTDSNDYWQYYPNPPGPDYESIYPIIIPGTAYNGSEIHSHRVAGNGTGLPPINSTNNPPINLAFLDTCHTGLENFFGAALLYPYGNIYVGTGPIPENQAEVGYTLGFQLDQFAACGEAFWGALLDGKTVEQAREAAYEEYEGANRPPTKQQFMHVWGDFYTRLKQVYTGSYFQLGTYEWFRSF